MSEVWGNNLSEMTNNEEEADSLIYSKQEATILTNTVLNVVDEYRRASASSRPSTLPTRA